MARQLVRIFSQKIKAFLNIINSTNWDIVCSQNDVNRVYNSFLKIITDAHEASFTLTRLSIQRFKDKVWVKNAL